MILALIFVISRIGFNWTTRGLGGLITLFRVRPFLCLAVKRRLCGFRRCRALGWRAGNRHGFGSRRLDAHVICIMGGLRWPRCLGIGTRCHRLPGCNFIFTIIGRFALCRSCPLSPAWIQGHRNPIPGLFPRLDFFLREEGVCPRR